MCVNKMNWAKLESIWITFTLFLKAFMGRSPKKWKFFFEMFTLNASHHSKISFWQSLLHACCDEKRILKNYTWSQEQELTQAYFLSLSKTLKIDVFQVNFCNGFLNFKKRFKVENFAFLENENCGLTGHRIKFWCSQKLLIKNISIRCKKSDF
jgi:hypothetical protein